MSWLDDVLSEASQNKLRSRVQRKYGGFPEWEEYFQTAISKLWEKLRDCDEKDITDALVYTTFDRLVIDSHRKLYRYARPREWLRNYGEIGIEIFKLKCIEGEKNNSVFEKLTRSLRNKNIPEETIVAELQLATIIVRKIDATDECNHGRRDRVAVDEIDRNETPGESGDYDGLSDPVSGMHALEVEVLMEFLLTGKAPEGVAMNSFEELIEAAKSSHLTNQQLLIVQLSYREGHTDKAGADILNIEPHTYRRRRIAALDVIKELFDQ